MIESDLISILLIPLIVWASSCSGCSPCEGCPTITCGNCAGGNTVSKQWEIAVAGVSNNSCDADCTVFNGTHILDETSPGSCKWRKTVGTGCCFTAVPVESCVIDLDVGATNTEIVFGGTSSGTFISYRMTTSAFDCNGPNTLSIFF